MEHHAAIKKGGDANSHTHGPNPEEVQALRLMGKMKRAAAEHPERSPSGVMRIFQEADPEVQTYLPTQKSMRKTIVRERLRDIQSQLR